MEQESHAESSLRARILGAASEMLATGGYKGLSIRQLAQKVGYSSATIYRYFTGKDAILSTLVEDGAHYLEGALRSALGPAPDDARSRLRAACHGYVQFGLDYPEYYRIMFMVLPRELTAHAQGPARTYPHVALMEDILAEGARQHLITASDVALAAAVIWSTLHGVLALSLSDRLDARLERAAFADAAVDSILRAWSFPAPTG